MNKKHATRLIVALVLAGGVRPASGQPTVSVSVDPPGTPIRRSIERIHKSTTPRPGKYFSVGYQTYLKGVAVRDLFEIDPAKTELSERTARFTHVEPEETACLEYVFPSSLVPSSASQLDYPVMNTTAHARHYVYYDANPDAAKGRDWGKIGDFRRGLVVAVYDLIDETDAIDPIMGVGTGTVVAVLRQSQRVVLPSGKSLDFAAYGERLFAEFLFQAKPVPAVSGSGLVGGVAGALTSGTVPSIDSIFRDSGIWLTMAPGGPLPPQLPTSPCPPTP